MSTPERPFDGRGGPAEQGAGAERTGAAEQPGAAAAEPGSDRADEGKRRDEDRPSLRRLTRGHAIAWIAAVALVFAMAADWYTNAQGVDARRTESIYQRQAGQSDEVGGPIREDAKIAGEEAEQNGFQADGAIDRLILIGLLTTAALAVLAGLMRAFGRRFEPPLTPSAVTALVGALTSLLLIYRLAINQPGFDGGTEVKLGGVLALVALSLVVFGAASALRTEEAAAETAGPAPKAPPPRDDERPPAPWLDDA